MICPNCGSQFNEVERFHATVFDCLRATRRECDGYQAQLKSQPIQTTTPEPINWQPVLNILEVPK